MVPHTGTTAAPTAVSTQPTEPQTPAASTPGASATASESADPDATTPPTAESEPATSLAPVEQPTPVGGPWTSIDDEVTSAAEADALTDVPESLRAFLASRLGEDETTGCVTESIRLRGVHPDGFAFGAEDSSCGDGQSLWGISEGQWRYIVQFADPQPCYSFTRLDIPTGVPGLRCTDDAGRAVDY